MLKYVDSYGFKAFHLERIWYYIIVCLNFQLVSLRMHLNVRQFF